jgi:teichuronic acid biosynthesis glycosyltransferase TuaH
MSKVVFLSNVPLGSTFRLGSHHLARELAQRGHEVVHVSTPVSTFERLIGREVKRRRGLSGSVPLGASHQRLAARSYRDEDGVTHDVPRPLLPTRWIRNSRAIRTLLSRGAAAAPDVVIIDQLLLSDALAGYSGQVIYRSTDVQTSRLGLELERAVIEKADGLVWCSAFVGRSTEPHPAGTPQLVLENGVDERFFDHAETPRSRSFVYVGAIDKRFDWRLVAALAERFPDVPIRIGGPVVVPSPVALPASVELLGTVPYERVAELLAGATIGLLPLNSDPMNSGRSPMKFFEYLAAGLRVLSTSTPELDARAGVPGVRLYRDLDEALAQAEELLREDGENTAGAAYAASYGWKSRAETLDRFILSIGD